MTDSQQSRAATPPRRSDSLSRRSLLKYAGLGAGLAAAGPLAAACDSSPKTSSTGKVNLQMWTWASAFEQNFAATIKEYQGANPNVTITPRYWDFASYSPALQAALAAGNEADLFMPVTLTLSLGKAKRVLDLKPLLGQEFLDRFFRSTNDENVWNGGQYAVGWAAQSFGFFYNKILLQKAGVQPPETWDDLIAMAATIRSKTGVTPLSMQGTPSNQLSDFLLPMITQVADDPQLALDLDAHEKAGVSWNSPPVIEALTKVRALVDAKVFDPGILAVDNNTNFSTFMSSKAAMIFSGTFFSPVLQTQAPKPFLKEYGIAKTPAWKSGGKHWCANQAGYTWSISANSKNQQEAVKFLKYLYEPARYLKSMNEVSECPSTKEAASGVTSPDIKEMVSWLVNGEGAPHILFGKGSLDAVSNGVVSVVQGSRSPAQAAKDIEDSLVQARKR